MKRVFLPVVIFSFFFLSQLNSQEIIHYWHFNEASGVLDTVFADYSKSTIDPYLLYRKIDEEGADIGIMDDVAGSDLNAREGVDAGRGIRPRNPSFNGELFIELNSASYENLWLSYTTQRSGSGMLKQVLYYTIDGENFIHFGDTVEVTTDFELVNFDFSAINEVNDNPDFAVIIRFLEQNEADNGNNRFDNIVLEGTPKKEQEVIHYWHFNSASGILDTVFADYFNGIHPSFLLYRKINEAGDDIGIMDDVGGSSINARNEYEAGRGIRPRNPSINGELFISLNSEGFSNLKLSYATERSGSGMLKQVLYYTVDGENFQPFGDTIEVNTSYNLVEFDFSSILEVENNPNFAVIIRFLEQNTADNGNNRFDNIVLEGTPKKEQEVIHYWHFNSVSGVLDTVFADYFKGIHPSFLLYRKINEAGDDIGIMDDVGGSSINARNDYEAGRGIRPRNPSINGELFISLNSKGFSNLKLSYATERSGSGMLKQVLYYTVDGENFQPFGDTIDVNTSYNLVEFDFSSILEVENNPDFAVIIRFLEQNTADNGNNRLDNLVMEGLPLGSSVEGVAINEDEVSLQIGETFQFTATILPPGAANQNLSWRTENEAIATINEEGLLTAVSVGSTIVIVTTEEGGFEDSVMVQVLSPFEVEVIVIEGSSFIFNAEVSLNGEVQLTDAAGSVVFEVLAGTYHLQVEKEGYLAFSRSIEISSDTILTVSLTPLSNTLIHYWHFNNIPIGTVEVLEADFTLHQGDRPTIYYGFLPDYVEDPTMTIGYMDDYVSGSTFNAQLGHPAGAALRVRNRSEGRALIIELPSIDAENLFLSFDVHRSGQGMLFNHFEYTLDGENWQNEGVDPLSISISPDYMTNFIDLTAVEGANNNPDFAIRISFEGNTNQGNGNNRYDNIALFANIISSVHEKNNTTNSLIVFPNPTTGVIKLESKEEAGSLFNSQYQLYDYQGRLIRSGNIKSIPTSIDFSDVQSGLYILVVNHSEGIEKSRLLIH